MSWEALGAPRLAAAGAVIISSSAGEGRLPPLLTVTLRLGRLPGLGFAALDGTCQVLFGRGEHAGRMRLTAGTGSRFFVPGRRGDGSTLSLRVALPAGLKPGKRGPEPVEHLVVDGALELRLPAWATPADRVTAPAPLRSGYVGVSERVPDPAASLRGRAGR